MSYSILKLGVRRTLEPLEFGGIGQEGECFQAGERKLLFDLVVWPLAMYRRYQTPLAAALIERQTPSDRP